MKKIFAFIKEKYQTEFINKIIEYKIKNKSISDFLFEINYSGLFYGLNPCKNLNLKNNENIMQYFIGDINDEKNLNNTNLIIVHENNIDKKIKDKLLSLLSFGGYLITPKEIYQKEELSDKFIKLFLNEFEDNFDVALLNTLKKGKFNYKQIPTKFNILDKYKKLLNEGKINKNENLENILIRKKIRSLSGISPITILTKQFPCPGKCIFCPQDSKMPKSYVKEEAACQRALRLKFDAYTQVKDRLTALGNAGHNTEKIELIILGGTFPYYTKKYQEEFIKDSLKALNGISKNSKKDLITLQKLNEKTKHKMVGLSVEIRPDFADSKTLDFLRYLGVTRIEIGVQSLDNKILEINKRGHSKEEIIHATKNLKDYGFKIMYHMMIGLPGSDEIKDKKVFTEIFKSKYFKPDQLKIYPCLIIKNTELSKIYKEINFVPFSDNQIINLITYIKSKCIPNYVRIARITRDIPSNLIIEGSKSGNIREEINKKLEENNIKCKCIRCREIKDNNYKKIKIKTIKLNLNEAKEYYIEAINENNQILGLGRLYLNKSNSTIRELHVFGKVSSIEKNEKNIQHKGLGEKLLKKMEHLSKLNGYKKIRIISAIGTRGYYRKFGYKLQNTYMNKTF